VTQMFLNGTAMAGQPDHACHQGPTFLGPARTSATVRFFAVRNRFPERLPPAEPRELELGIIELLDGEIVQAMLLVPSRLSPGDKVVDISELGGFRACQRFLDANAHSA